MRREIPRAKATWLVITDRWQELTLISEGFHWFSHWDTYLKRSRRCGGMACGFCQAGVEKQLRVVVLAVDGRGQEKLIELRARHLDNLERLPTWVGQRVRIKREGSAKNSPVTVQCLDVVVAVERDLSRLVDSLGLPPVLVGQEPTLADQPAPSRDSPELTAGGRAVLP